jgi:dephospho-CoA kinase
VTAPYCLLAIPLLVERGNYQQLDRVLVVDCPEEMQIARVMARDKLTAQEVTAIMRTQATRQERLNKADDVVNNATDVPSIQAHVKALHAEYLALAAQHAASD